MSVNCLYSFHGASQKRDVTLNTGNTLIYLLIKMRFHNQHKFPQIMVYAELYAKLYVWLMMMLFKHKPTVSQKWQFVSNATDLIKCHMVMI